MLDVHAPHSPMHGAKDFFLHLFTITVGLLIATQIESCMEWRHHVHLAEEARVSLRTEIQQNLEDLKGAGPDLQKWRKEVADDLGVMARIQANPNDKAAQKASLSVNSHGFRLRNTAWKTAEMTGALAYMPYDEAQRYARIYQARADLLVLEDKPTEDVARIFGLLAKFDTFGGKQFSEEQASALAEQLGAMQLHLAAGSAFLKENIELNQAFMEGREAKGDFSEQLK
jgi:hypothetical protein